MWLKFLNGRKTKLRGQALILYKIALDRLLYSPAFNILQMCMVYKVGGLSWPQALQALRRTFWTAQLGSLPIITLPSLIGVVNEFRGQQRIPGPVYLFPFFKLRRIALTLPRTHVTTPTGSQATEMG